MTTIASPQSVCTRIARRLALSVGAQRYSMWFDRAARLSYRDEQNCLDVAVPNRFVADWIGRNFQVELRRAASDELGQDVALSVFVDAASFPESRPVPGDASAASGAPASSAAPAASALGLAPAFATPVIVRRQPRSPARAAGSLSLRYRLDDFIVGPSNELAFAAASRLVDEDTAPANPLFVHGGVGLGKTHLLQGICRRMLDQHPDARVLYTTGEQFTNEFLTAVRSNTIEAFRRRIRRLDLLAVDDVHFIANKVATQQEFLHSFNEIELGGAKVVLASDCHPKLIQQFSEALVSRCVRGLVVEIRQPDTATRMKIVRALAARRGISLLETVVAVIAARCQGSIREIEGALTKLHALANLTDQYKVQSPKSKVEEGMPAPSATLDLGPCTLDSSAHPLTPTIGHALVNRLFSTELQDATPRAVRFDTILSVVAEHLQVRRDLILSANRHREVVLARSLSIHLARQLTSLSYPEIAAAFGRASHSAVISAAQRIARLLSENYTVLVPATSSPQPRLEQLPFAELIERLKRAIAKAG